MLKLFKNRNGKLRGLTLIEALLFLGIAAIVIIGAVAFYNNASNSSKMNQAMTQIQAYVAGTKSLYASQNSYSTLSNELLIASRKAPDNAVRGADALTNPWSGSTTVTGSDDYFEIEMAGLTDDACTALLSANMLDNGSIYYIAGNEVVFENGASPDPAAAMAACDLGAANAVTFRAR